MKTNRTVLGFRITGLILCFLFSSLAQATEVKTYKVSGTGSALSTIRLLADEFSKTRPDVHLQVLPSLGTTGGIKALMADAIDLSLAARPLTPEEEKLPISSHPYSHTPVAFVTNLNNETENLSTEEITKIFAGETTHWPNGDYIRLVMRSLRESDFIPIIKQSDILATALMKASKRRDTVYAAKARDNTHTLESLPGSFGLSNLAMIQTENVKVKVLAYNGIDATLSQLQAGRYPFSKTFALIYKNQSLPDGLAAFVKFTHSRKACQILKTNAQLCVSGD